jgi:hypothetical protein
MHWPSEIRTHDLGKVETLLVHRKVDRSMAFDAFFDVLTRPTPGQVHPAATG